MSLITPDRLSAPSLTPAPARVRRIFAALLRAALSVAAGVLLGLSLLTLPLMRTPWWLDIPSHFLPQVTACAGLLTLGALVLRASRGTLVILCLAAVLGVLGLYPFIGDQDLPATAAGAPLKILQANVEDTNRHTGALKDLIAAENPDLVVIAEANTAFAKLFAALKKDYPYQDVRPDDTFSDGLAILSKTPLVRDEPLAFPGADMPALAVRIQHDGTVIDVISLHTTNPLRSVTRRDAAFDGVAAVVQKEKPENLVVLGDFNATPWCSALRRLMTELPQLRNARAGRGIYLSWPSFLPAFMRIAIDQTLTSRTLAVTDYRLGPPIGSDHLPVISTLALVKP